VVFGQAAKKIFYKAMYLGVKRQGLKNTEEEEIEGGEETFISFFRRRASSF